MDQFVFEGKQRMVLIGMMALGLLCLGLGYFMEPSSLVGVIDGQTVNTHSRFWTNLLHNSVFFIGIGFISFFFIAASLTAYAGWYVVFKRIWEAFGSFIIVGLLLMLVLAAANWGHWNHLYHWAGDITGDRILEGKSGFLNNYWYTFGTIIIVGLWYFFWMNMRRLSLQEDVDGGNDNFSHHKKMRKWSAIFLPIAGFSSAAIIWQWVMSIDGHWYSTMFAWYATASWFVAAMSLTVLLMIYLRSKGYYEKVTDEHMHDLGKLVFAFTVFWTYLWFSQYMLIWYANNGEETVYFNTRIDSYPILFYGNLIINFALPFLILLRNDTKRKTGTLIFVSVLAFFGHWWDYFQMIKPGVVHTVEGYISGSHHGDGHHTGGFIEGFTIPGFIELGTLIGFLGLFLYVTLSALSKASLYPKNDPYYNESLHHHVGYGGGTETHH